VIHNDTRSTKYQIHYFRLSLNSTNDCLHFFLVFSIFPSIMCSRRHSLHQMRPIHLAFLCCPVSHVIPFPLDSNLTLLNLSHDQFIWSFPSFSRKHISNFLDYVAVNKTTFFNVYIWKMCKGTSFLKGLLWGENGGAEGNYSLRRAGPRVHNWKEDPTLTSFLPNYLRLFFFIYFPSIITLRLFIYFFLLFLMSFQYNFLPSTTKMVVFDFS
jgi:hypothetical protein